VTHKVGVKLMSRFKIVNHRSK